MHKGLTEQLNTAEVEYNSDFAECELYTGSEQDEPGKAELSQEEQEEANGRRLCNRLLHADIPKYPRPDAGRRASLRNPVKNRHAGRTKAGKRYSGLS